MTDSALSTASTKTYTLGTIGDHIVIVKKNGGKCCYHQSEGR